MCLITSLTRQQVPQDGRYWCEGDGCFIDVPEQRYMMTAKVADASGEVYVTVFNEQVGFGVDCAWIVVCMNVKSVIVRKLWCGVEGGRECLGGLLELGR